MGRVVKGGLTRQNHRTIPIQAQHVASTNTLLNQAIPLPVHRNSSPCASYISNSAASSRVLLTISPTILFQLSRLCTGINDLSE